MTHTHLQKLEQSIATASNGVALVNVRDVKAIILEMNTWRDYATRLKVENTPQPDNIFRY